MSDGDDDDGAEGENVAPATADLFAELARIALAETPSARTRIATDLARRLVDLADDADAAALGTLLRANPTREATVWRVLQFRLGDVSPSTEVAHDDPVTAVCAVARPGDGGLVAGELVAVDADGSSWTAIARTDDELVVQMPSPRTLSGPAAAPDAVGALLLAWRAALGARPPAPPTEPTPAPAAAAATIRADRAVPAAEPSGEARPQRAQAALDRLRAALQADLDDRLTEVEARLALAAEEGARAAVAHEIDELRGELHQLRDQLARLEKLLTG